LTPENPANMQTFTTATMFSPSELFFEYSACLKKNTRLFWCRGIISSQTHQT